MMSHISTSTTSLGCIKPEWLRRNLFNNVTTLGERPPKLSKAGKPMPLITGLMLDHLPDNSLMNNIQPHPNSSRRPNKRWYTNDTYTSAGLSLRPAESRRSARWRKPEVQGETKETLASLCNKMPTFGRGKQEYPWHDHALTFSLDGCYNVRHDPPVHPSSQQEEREKT